MAGRIAGLMTVLVLGLATGCTPMWTGNQMQADIAELKAQQASLNEDLGERQKELSDMAAKAANDVQELDRVLKEATALFQRNNADYGAEIEVIRREIQRLSGDVEKTRFDMMRLQQDLELFKEDVDIRFADGGGAQLPDGAAELAAMAATKLKEGDSRTARKAAEALIKKHPTDKRIPEMFWVVGESYFNEKQWVSAAYEYQNILQKFGRSDRADDATYRIGETFQRLGKCAEAKLFFETVVKDHARSPWKDDAQKKLRELKGCK